MKTLTIIAAAALAAAACASAQALACGDAAKGNAKFEASCADCHDKGELKPADFTTKVKAIVAGTAKHKKALKLTHAEIADLAAAVGEKCGK
jgi:cytochrome c2